MKHYFIPNLSTSSGGCLTSENWEQVGVDIVSYSLSALLIKPGIEYLKLIPDLASYVGWNRSLVLNASSLILNKNENYILRSHYDGKTLSYTADELWDLIIHLSPQIVILPQGFTKVCDIHNISLPENMLLFLSIDEYQDKFTCKKYGVYLDFYEGMEDDLLKKLSFIDSIPTYVCGPVSIIFLQKLIEFVDNLSLKDLTRENYHFEQDKFINLKPFVNSLEKNNFDDQHKSNSVEKTPFQGAIEDRLIYIESDKPSQDACNGLVYILDGIFDLSEPCDSYHPQDDTLENLNLERETFEIDINDKLLDKSFDVIDSTCKCLTCKQKLTRTYLRHLYAHTPLLCERFLIQHNWSFTSA